MQTAEVVLSIYRQHTRNEPLESRVLGNLYARFGGGHTEKGQVVPRRVPTLRNVC
jgi:hypothetical protein